MNSDYWRTLIRRAKEFGEHRQAPLQRALAWADHLAVAKAFVASLDCDQRWAMLQALAGEGSRFYGGDGTIHETGTIDITVDRSGKVREVWFRCQPLPFKVYPADSSSESYNPGIDITGVIVSLES